MPSQLAGRGSIREPPSFARPHLPPHRVAVLGIVDRDVATMRHKSPPVATDNGLLTKWITQIRRPGGRFPVIRKWPVSPTGSVFPFGAIVPHRHREGQDISPVAPAVRAGRLSAENGRLDGDQQRGWRLGGYSANTLSDSLRTLFTSVLIGVAAIAPEYGRSRRSNRSAGVAGSSQPS